MKKINTFQSAPKEDVIIKINEIIDWINDYGNRMKRASKEVSKYIKTAKLK